MKVRARHLRQMNRGLGHANARTGKIRGISEQTKKGGGREGRGTAYGRYFRVGDGGEDTRRRGQGK